MTNATTEINKIIQDRALSHWHLLVASLLGSLASQQGIFNQAFLNRIIGQSVREFLIPYFMGLPEYEALTSKIEKCAEVHEQIESVVSFVDEMFGLAGQIETEAGPEGTTLVTVKSSGCRFCPVGVGRATLRPDMTFCPFPTLIEQTARHMLNNDTLKTVHRREGTRTRILQKEDGHCKISFEVA